jgi:uncharacterized membrane protein YfcA
MFELAAFLAAAFGGGVASVAGFGIGSLLTPVLATEAGARLAVAAVSIPHIVGTSIRFWRLRRAIDWRIVRSFGLMSAAGGIAGAVLNTFATSRALAMVFGSLLVLAGALQLTGYAKRWRLRGTSAWLGGALSGFFGGLVGNQGGIRTAAMLGFEVDKRQFVATTTAVALAIDLARVPIYIAAAGSQLLGLASVIAIAGAGVVLGTLFGERLLAGVPEQHFRTVVAALLVLLGLSILVRGHA